MGLEEVGRSPLDGAIAVKIWSLVGCTGGLVAGAYVSWALVFGRRGGLCGGLYSALGLTWVFFIFLVGQLGSRK